MILVRKHKGRSGMSVFEWRVYRVTDNRTTKNHTTQLGKYRTVEEANRAADHYRQNDIRVAQRWREIEQRGKP
jgi:hypothetical protein